MGPLKDTIKDCSLKDSFERKKVKPLKVDFDKKLVTRHNKGPEGKSLTSPTNNGLVSRRGLVD